MRGMLPLSARRVGWHRAAHVDIGIGKIERGVEIVSLLGNPIIGTRGIGPVEWWRVGWMWERDFEGDVER